MNVAGWVVLPTWSQQLRIWNSTLLVLRPKVKRKTNVECSERGGWAPLRRKSRMLLCMYIEHDNSTFSPTPPHLQTVWDTRHFVGFLVIFHIVCPLIQVTIAATQQGSASGSSLLSRVPSLGPMAISTKLIGRGTRLLHRVDAATKPQKAGRLQGKGI